jgi:glucose-1-phosphate cytidylyltransferase
MKAVILAGGKGTRLSEETSTRPKPMVEIGGMPILWHIMKHYASHGVDEFIICLGHKGPFIKEWFMNHRIYGSDLEIDLRNDEIKVLSKVSEPWKVILAETGEDSLTATRLAKVKKYLTQGETFFMTYGDGVGDIDIRAQLAAHKAAASQDGRLATVTVVSPPGRFGAVESQGDLATAFVEKPSGDGQKISAGFFVIEPAALDYIVQEDCMWEEGPLKTLATQGKLGIWRHDGFWQPMDTLRDKTKLEEIWSRGAAPWKTWE